ncbi:MarR family winged helix-turn-helix transcriptional regulator [Nocardioides sp. URHA0020]|uniref:MarR family winged helix-turn-helix transcriptional regulator n=1 Tax=Nocardioides sp. URHA0020 TaxID=1380392 RepID=UPI0006842D55|nr:MarR family transcriptional regulator [Nocardioides sp. URHA0020]
MVIPEVTESRVLLPSLAQNDGHLFWRAAARVHAALAETLPPGVDVHEYAALLSLAGGVTRTQQSIASAISTSRTTVVKVAADLAAQGLVTRVRNPDDRRSYALTRTAEGAAAARRWRRHVEDLDEALTSVFTIDEHEELRQLLVRISEGELAQDTPPPLLESVGFLITRVHFRMHREFSAVLAPLGIEPRHKGCLAALHESGPISQAELARILGVSAASVVQMVDDMERRGLVERRRPDTDRRTQLLHLLPAAETVAAEAGVLSDGLTSALLAVLTPAERTRLTGYLVRFVTAP